jgi:brefeldin A-resistance guanine nucleotide exchange factor 1
MDISEIPLQSPSLVVDRGPKNSDGGFISGVMTVFQNYVNNDPEPPTDFEIEMTLCTVDCINSCSMGDIFADVVYVFSCFPYINYANDCSSLPIKSLKPLIKALLSQLPEDPSSIDSRPESAASESSPPVPPTTSSYSTNPKYDASTVYILELCTVLALRDEETITVLGGDVAEALQNVMRNASSFHHITVSRTMYYVLRLLHRGYVCNPS